MKRRPEPAEAAPFYSKYIDRVKSDDVVESLAAQADETLAFLRGISEEKSLHRYAPDKWSVRQLLNHVNDAERVFMFRALWFARGYEGPLPSYDEKVAAGTAHAHDVPWERHVEEFRAIRLATLAFFGNLPEEAWERSGVASGNAVTVRALAYIVAGHAAHHRAILEERYL